MARPRSSQEAGVKRKRRSRATEDQDGPLWAPSDMSGDHINISIPVKRCCWVPVSPSNPDNKDMSTWGKYECNQRFDFELGLSPIFCLYWEDYNRHEIRTKMSQVLGSFTEDRIDLVILCESHMTDILCTSYTQRWKGCDWITNSLQSNHFQSPNLTSS